MLLDSVCYYFEDFDVYIYKVPWLLLRLSLCLWNSEVFIPNFFLKLGMKFFLLILLGISIFCQYTKKHRIT